MVLCRDCGLGRLDPLDSPERLHDYYAEQYRTAYKGSFEPRRTHTYRSGMAALNRYSWVRRSLPANCRVLEVGSGGGEFAYLLTVHGHRVTGIEPHRGYSEYARRELGLDVVTGPFEKFASMASGPYDAAMLFHVLEHVPAPVSFLSAIGRHLSPGALLYIEVPNLRTTAGHPRRRFHSAHTLYFEDITLHACCAAAGYELLEPYASEDGGNVGGAFRWTASPQPFAALVQGNFERTREWESALHQGSYYLRGVTWRRFGGRWKNYANEYLAVISGLRGRALLDTLFGTELRRIATA